MINEVPVLTGELAMMVLYNIAHSPMLYLVMGFITLDFLTGSYKAAKTGQFSSKVGINGLIKHLLVLMLIVFLKFFGRVFELHAVIYAMSVAFSLNYLISIVENLEASGVVFPNWVKIKLKQMQDHADNEITIEDEDEIIVRKNTGKKGVDR